MVFRVIEMYIYCISYQRMERESKEGRKRGAWIKVWSRPWPCFELFLAFWNLTKIKQAVAASSRPLVLCINLGVDFEVKIMKFCGNFKLESIAFTFYIPQRKKKCPAM